MSSRKCLECPTTLIDPHHNRKYCKTCAKKLALASSAKSIKTWKTNNPDKVKAANKSWLERFPLKRRLSHAKDIARTRELVFDLSNEELLEFWNQPCHYCHQSILHQTGIGLDRKDNTLGYVKGNVLPCCGDCNYVRSDVLTVEEMEVAMNAVLKFRNGDK